MSQQRDAELHFLKVHTLRGTPPEGSPSIGSAASHTHAIGIPIRRGSEVSLTTNFPFTPECGLSVSHRLDIMRSLHDLTRCNNAVVATLIRIYVSGEVEPKYFSV